jgi:hypothetical protein
MRNFTDYVERTKSQIEGEDYADVLFEGFAQDIMNLENIDAIKAFILGFISGTDIDLTKNKNILLSLLEKQEFKNVSEIIKNLKIDSKVDESDLRKKLAKSLTRLKPIIKKDRIDVME